ncbi:hypothetical protein [Polaromonas sp. CG9_12]|nr:hypothetical protein [Polaromonas sp. CG9_12]
MSQAAKKPVGMLRHGLRLALPETRAALVVRAAVSAHAEMPVGAGGLVVAGSADALACASGWRAMPAPEIKPGRWVVM